MTEEGRKAKERFIEKEREMARTEAKKRKLEEKKAREQILMQIADDREIRKMKSGVKTETSSTTINTSSTGRCYVFGVTDILCNFLLMCF